jgi:hypothetical protein
MIPDEVIHRELYAELGELAVQFLQEARHHLGPIRVELERGAAQIRLVRVMYWEGSVSALAALDWLNDGRAVIRNVRTWERIGA